MPLSDLGSVANLFGMDLSSLLATIAGRRLGIDTEAGTMRGRLQQEAGIGRQRAQQAYGTGQTNINDQLASQGLFHSGIRVNEQGQLTQDYSQQLADIGRAESTGLADIESQRSSALSNLAGEEQRARVQAAREEEERRAQIKMQEALAAFRAPQPQTLPTVGFQPPAYAPPPAPRYLNINSTPWIAPSAKGSYYNPRTKKYSNVRPAGGNQAYAF